MAGLWSWLYASPAQLSFSVSNCTPAEFFFNPHKRMGVNCIPQIVISEPQQELHAETDEFKSYSKKQIYPPPET